MSAAESQDDETTSSLDRAKDAVPGKQMDHEATQTTEYERLKTRYDELVSQGVPPEQLINPLWPRGVASTVTGQKMDEAHEQLSLLDELEEGNGGQHPGA